METLPVQLTKMSGAGNTFILVDASSSNAWKNFEEGSALSRSELAQKICGPIFGLSTDGLLILEKAATGLDYSWDFYNSDGSMAEMCGNAARCAARFCFEVIEKKQRRHFRFMTKAGLIQADILANNGVRVHMPPVDLHIPEIKLPLQASEESFFLTNTGVPHLVQKVHAISLAQQLKEMAREARSHPRLQPQGANVTFYAVENKSQINAITFERGVEDFTLACGTGAVAAGLVHALSTYPDAKESLIEVMMPGGPLKVIFISGQSRPFLEGPALFIGNFHYSNEVFHEKF